jgi:hypothetical protein
MGVYSLFLPDISEMINSTMNMKNKILAILAAPAAIPPKPNTPAIMAKMINMIVQRNITVVFLS